uniref:AT hook motif-containing protein n=2 Tax=Noccaea caerulescens TaxID=107243 RepID=A0A1J3FB01_NOCCA
MEKESHEEENNSHTISGDFMAKRKRGRPRKHTKLEPNEQSLGPTPPGFNRSQQQQPRHRDDEEAMVGLPVTGVIEATFEAGYFLSVKVGNSDSVLRGVVFKPGRCDPVTDDNDVAPDVPMIGRKSEVVQHHHGSANGGRKSRIREKRGGNNVRTPVPIQPAHPTTHNNFVVPAMLQTVNPQNGPVRHGSMQTETGSQASNGKPFETLLTQVMNDGQVHHTAQSIEGESDEQALSIEPLQAIHPVHPVHVPKPMPSYGRGNMTELLQAVQGNVRDAHFSQGQ